MDRNTFQHIVQHAVRATVEQKTAAAVQAHAGDIRKTTLRSLGQDRQIDQPRSFSNDMTIDADTHDLNPKASTRRLAYNQKN